MMKIEMNKKNISIITVYGIITLIYLLAFLTIPFQKWAASWISMVFTMISLVLSLGVCLYVFGCDGDITSKFYGLPIFKIAYLYPFVQFSLGVLICLIGAFVWVPYWVALLLGVILLGLAAIGVIVTDNARDVVEETEAEVVRVTKATKLFNLNIASVLDICTDETAKKELEKLAEMIRFSDPVSNVATEEIETQILTKLDDLKLHMADMQIEDLLKHIATLKALMNERNRICKAEK